MTTKDEVKWVIENWKVIFGLLTFIATLSGWYKDSSAKAEQIDATQKQVAAVASAYQPYVTKTIEKTVVIQDSKLEKKFEQHLRTLH